MNVVRQIGREPYSLEYARIHADYRRYWNWRLKGLELAPKQFGTRLLIENKTEEKNDHKPCVLAMQSEKEDRMELKARWKGATLLTGAAIACAAFLFVTTGFGPGFALCVIGALASGVSITNEGIKEQQEVRVGVPIKAERARTPQE